MKILLALEKIYKVQNNRPENNWIRASANIACALKNWDIIRMAQFRIQFYKKNQCVKENKILLDRLFYKEKSQRIYIDATLAPTKYDSIKVVFLNPKDAQGSFYVSDLLLEYF
jgi:hypothetical protein